MGNDEASGKEPITTRAMKTIPFIIGKIYTCNKSQNTLHEYNDMEFDSWKKTSIVLNKI